MKRTRIFPVFTYAWRISGSTSSAYWPQPGHSKSPCSTSSTLAAGLPSTYPADVTAGRFGSTVMMRFLAAWLVMYDSAAMPATAATPNPMKKVFFEDFDEATALACLPTVLRFCAIWFAGLEGSVKIRGCRDGGTESE